MDLKNKKTVVAIGKFDGVHIGHRELLITAADLAKGKGLVSLCFIITPKDAKTILHNRCRDRLISSYGINEILVQNLSGEFMNQSPDEFVENILKNKLNCDHAVVGYNFRFAKDRCADAEDLKRLCAEKNIACTVIPEVRCNNIVASSTNVREAMKTGDIKTAVDILGRAYTIEGKVTEGKKIGRTLDFPTANIIPDENLILPQNGVYATYAVIDDVLYPAVTNIGDNPTVNTKGNITVETHIIGYDGDIYGKNLVIEFKEKIRDQIKFDSVKDLKKQIDMDVNYSLSFTCNASPFRQCCQLKRKASP